MRTNKGRMYITLSREAEDLLNNCVGERNKSSWIDQKIKEEFNDSDYWKERIELALKEYRLCIAEYGCRKKLEMSALERTQKDNLSPEDLEEEKHIRKKRILELFESPKEVADISKDILSQTEANPSLLENDEWKELQASRYKEPCNKLDIWKEKMIGFNELEEYLEIKKPIIEIS